MAGYIRNDVTNEISDANVINAAPLNGEFDAVEAAFNTISGHRHDGTSAEGAPITVVGPAQDIVVTATVLRPKTDNVVDLGTPSLEFKNLWIDGTANIDSLVADTADINSGTIDATVIGGVTPAAVTTTSLVATTATINGGAVNGVVIGATTPAAATVTSLTATSGTIGGAEVTTLSNVQGLTNKTINLANNTLVATSAQLETAITDQTGTGLVVFSASPALTGVPTGPTAAAATNTTQIATTAHVFAERSNTATLTNKTLTSPVISGGTISSLLTPLAIASGGTGATTAAQARINLGVNWTEVGPFNTSSGTAFDVNGIPDGVTEVEILFDFVSMSGTDNILVLLGAFGVGTLDLTGYQSGRVSFVGTTVAAPGAVSDGTNTGFVVPVGAADSAVVGVMRLVRGSNASLWHYTLISSLDGVTMQFGAGRKYLSTTRLSDIRIQRSGTNTFDNGFISVRYR